MNDSPDIRLVAIDLDGTLLNDLRAVSSQTAAGLTRVADRGVKVVLASARPPRSVRHIYRELKLETLQVNYNGAMIWNEPMFHVEHHQPLEPAIALKIIESARQFCPAVLVSCEVFDRWITDRVDPQYLTETAKLFPPDAITTVNQMCVEPVTKVLLMGPSEMITHLNPLLVQNHPDVCVLRSDPDLIQIMHRDVNKGAALQTIARYYRVEMRHVMAIGDAANDIPMLQAAGISIAMGNASAEVKYAADWVAPSNNDHGVHAALERYGLYS